MWGRAVAGVIAAMVLAACSSGAGQEQAIRDVLHKFDAAGAAGDYATMCDLSAANLHRTYTALYGSCEAGFEHFAATYSAQEKTDLAGANYTMIRVDGDSATAEDPATKWARHKLVKVDGRWLVTD